jgi:3D (Asp-Asp-Asp) domain-containing protein
MHRFLALLFALLVVTVSGNTAQARTHIHRPTHARYGYTQIWLVTYYLATGNRMANGVYPSVGWAACGYDVALGSRIYVPGFGTFTCGDRIGFQPWHHIDIFGVPLGTHYSSVTVYP